MNIGEGNGKVYLGIPRERVYMTQFVDVRDAVLARIQEAEIGAGYYQAEGHRVDRNRDRICQEFLTHKDQPEWLLMIDSDMDHPEHLAQRLIKWGKPIVGALYFHRGQRHDPFAFKDGPELPDTYGRPTRTWIPMRDEVYSWLLNMGVPMRDGAVEIDGADDTALVECDAIATGAILLHRSVLETMPAPWFEYEAGGNSEDLTFCYKAKHTYHFPVYCDFSTICGHFHWVPMGQVQFRMMYEGRGINLTTFSKRDAMYWLSDFFCISQEEAKEWIETASAHVVGEYWESKFHKRKPTSKQVEKFYTSLETGRLYILELLHWNYTPTFNSIRQLLTHLRGQQIVEIGSGIGTTAMQLCIQNNAVLAIEPNDLLREFTAYRWELISKEVETAFGAFTVTPNLENIGVPDSSIDTVVALDVLEHLPAKVLEAQIKEVARILKPEGHFIYHNNFLQQEIYPMHYDHTVLFPQLLAKNGFLRLTEMEAVKGVAR